MKNKINKKNLISNEYAALCELKFISNWLIVMFIPLI